MGRPYLSIEKLTSGRLTATGRDPLRPLYCICKCSCGNTVSVRKDCLTAKLTLSCGCFQKEQLVARSVTHGDWESPEWFAWNALNQRCTNPKSISWKYYGGRGITVCPEWRHDYPAFLAHVGRKPGPEYSIDRWPDQNGNYEPGNVRWATDHQQQWNRRDNGILIIDGEVRPLAAVAHDFGISSAALHLRIFKYKWPIAKSLTTPVKKGRSKCQEKM